MAPYYLFVCKPPYFHAISCLTPSRSSSHAFHPAPSQLVYHTRTHEYPEYFPKYNPQAQRCRGGERERRNEMLPPPSSPGDIFSDIKGLNLKMTLLWESRATALLNPIINSEIRSTGPFARGCAGIWASRKT